MRVLPKGCWNIPSIPGRESFAAWRRRRSCSAGTTVPLRSGGRNSANRGPGCAGPTCGRGLLRGRRPRRNDSEMPRPIGPLAIERLAMINRIIENIEKEYLKKDAPQFAVGDTVDVHTR